jgi:rhodanese-related sulfurtransferase
MPDSQAVVPLELGVQEARQLLAEQSAMLLLDCRNQHEFEFVHIEGACFIPMDEISERVREIDEFRSRRIIVYCHLGGRSLHVASWLRQQGFQQAQSMTGGVDAWAEQIDVSLPRY